MLFSMLEDSCKLPVVEVAVPVNGRSFEHDVNLSKNRRGFPCGVSKPSLLIHVITLPPPFSFFLGSTYLVIRESVPHGRHPLA